MGYDELHAPEPGVAPQLIPAGLDPTSPNPATPTDKVNSWRNVALTSVSAEATDTVQAAAVPDEAQPPPQLSKIQPASGVAVSVTVVVANDAA